MAPKKAVPTPVEEAPPEAVEPPPPPEPTEDEVTELSTGLRLPLRGIDVGRIWACGEDYGAQASLIAELLQLEETWPSKPQRQIVCEFCIYNLAQAKALCLTMRQGAVLHAIMAQVLQLMRCRGISPRTMPKELECDTRRGMQEFTSLMLNHSVSKPPDRLDIFKVSEVKLITDFCSVSLFKHFVLYQFCINCPQEVQTLRVRRTVQRPLPPPDLSAARLRPRRWRARGKAPGEDVAGPGSGDGSAGGGEGDSKVTDAVARDVAEGGEDMEAEEDLSPEEQEINRLVEEKLREKEVELEAKLAAREEAFLAKLAAKQEEAAAAKPKKK